MEKCGKSWKNCHFSGRIWPDWGNNAWADMAGLGSKGLKPCNTFISLKYGKKLFQLLKLGKDFGKRFWNVFKFLHDVTMHQVCCCHGYPVIKDYCYQ